MSFSRKCTEFCKRFGGFDSLEFKLWPFFQKAELPFASRKSFVLKSSSFTNPLLYDGNWVGDNLTAFTTSCTDYAANVINVAAALLNMLRVYNVRSRRNMFQFGNAHRLLGRLGL